MKKKNFKLISLFLFVVLCCPLFLVSCDGQAQAFNYYKINARFDDSQKTLDCQQSVEYANTSENLLNEICFFLYANAYSQGQKTISTAYFDKAYPNGESFGHIEFEKVEIDGCATEYLISEDKTVLTVMLAESLYPDESVTIDMTYDIQMANINHRLGYGENAINFGNFFPIACVYEDGFVRNKFTANGDPFYSDVSNFEVTISCPKDFVVASTGVKQETIEGNEKKIICQAEKVRDFCFVISKKFQLISQDVDGVIVNYYFHDDNLANDHLQTSIKALKLFKNKFGEYSYSQLSVVQTNFCFGGMEYPNLVMINDAINDKQTYDYVIVHEIAHQWWYGMVGNNQYTDSWVDEGLTEFSTALFFETYSEYGIDYNTIMTNAAETYKNFVGVFEKIYGEVDQSMTRNLSEFATEPEYVNCAYTKGMLLFDSLRNSMSDSKFFKCIRNYFNDYQFKNSSSEKLIESFSKSSHINLGNFFDSWMDGSVVIG